MAVAPTRIVEHLDVIEYFGASQITSFVDPLFDTLFFQAAEELLSNRIIPAVSTATHTGLEIVLFTKP